jgi:hypothetical protein
VQELIQAVGQAQEKGYKSILTFGGSCGEEPFFFTLFSKDICMDNQTKNVIISTAVPVC